MAAGWKVAARAITSHVLGPFTSIHAVITHVNITHWWEPLPYWSAKERPNTYQLNGFSKKGGISKDRFFVC